MIISSPVKMRHLLLAQKAFIMLKKLITFSLLIIVAAASAAFDKPLPVDSAFQLSGYVSNQNHLVLEWQIAPGYYLYAERFNLKIADSSTIALKTFTFPVSITKKDDIVGNYPVFQDYLRLEIPFNNPDDLTTLILNVAYQGCSNNKFCYPPETKQLLFNLKDKNSTRVQAMTTASLSNKVSTQDHILDLLANKSMWLILLSFFGFGLLLSFTPCVLPMFPILLSLIIGRRTTITTFRALTLSMTYVAGMAITYASIGIIAGLAGQSIQSTLQKPIIIGIFSGMFVLLALSLFGLYEIRLPHRLSNRIADLSHQQKRFSYLGAAIMGILGTLIVSPCVTPPLIGALSYIANTGHALLGGLALFTLAVGMGTPLILIGASHGKLLPRTGEWMNAVKAFLGVSLLATAIWMLSRVIPATITMLLWAVLLIMCSVYLGSSTTHKQKERQKTGWQKFWLGIALVFAIYGTLLMIGATMGNSDLLRPLQASHTRYPIDHATRATGTFKLIKTNSDFNTELLKAIQKRQITLMDFYADWCIACKEMDRNVFNDPTVQKKLSNLNLLRANITHDDIEDKALRERFHVIGPPVVLFFDSDGNELTSFRLVGNMGKADFLEHLEELMQSGHR